VRFTITLHSGYDAPPDALERLFEQVGPTREDARFAMASSEIRATWGEDAPTSMESDEREQRGRSALLEILEEACERSSDLKLDWFAVSARRY
jgi:hypothetical protein